MPGLHGVFFVVAALLAAGGLGKALKPKPTSAALAPFGLPRSTGLIRAMGVAEISLAIVAVATGHTVAAAFVAVIFLGFAAFVLAALLRDIPIRSCGCFGQTETPPSIVHVAVNLVAASVAAVVAGHSATPLHIWWSKLPLAGVLFTPLAMLCVFLVVTALTTLPQTLTLIRQEASSP